MIQVNFEQKIKGVASQVQHGLLSPNEGRALLNLPPREDGDRYWMPKNMRYSDQADEEPDEDEGTTKEGKQTKERNGTGGNGENKESKKGVSGSSVSSCSNTSGEMGDYAARCVVRDAVERVVVRIARQATRAAAKPGKFLDWLDELRDAPEAVSETFGAAGVVLAERREQPAGEVVDQLTRAVLGMAHERLLTVSGECTPAELAGRVAHEVENIKNFYPAQLAEEMLCYEHAGTADD